MIQRVIWANMLYFESGCFQEFLNSVLSPKVSGAKCKEIGVRFLSKQTNDFWSPLAVAYSEELVVKVFNHVSVEFSFFGGAIFTQSSNIFVEVIVGVGVAMEVNGSQLLVSYIEISKETGLLIMESYVHDFERL